MRAIDRATAAFSFTPGGWGGEEKCKRNTQFLWGAALHTSSTLAYYREEVAADLVR